MVLIELAREVGLELRKSSSAHGGEFHSACPACGGHDRFIIWPQKGRYWCRQCRISGDTIQFCRDFMRMGFSDAVKRGGDKRIALHMPFSPREDGPKIPPKSWAEKGAEFIKSCHQRLLIDPEALRPIQQRGLSLETISKVQIGWNPLSLFPKREDWGLERKIEEGKEKKLFLPSGWVIPTFIGDTLQKIKIRRNESGEGKFNKYHVVTGSIDTLPIFGPTSADIAVIVEAEFDGMLVAQEAGDFCCCMALGGAQKRPSQRLSEWLQKKKALIFALDFDEAGKREYSYWCSAYTNLFAWPVPMGKSPEEAWKMGVDLRRWLLGGVQRIKIK